MFFYGLHNLILLFVSSTGARGDSLTILQAPDFVSFRKGDWPISGETIPDLVALTMGFSVKEVPWFLTQQLTFFSSLNCFSCTIFNLLIYTG